MNIKRGMIRAWIVASVVWVVASLSVYILDAPYRVDPIARLTPPDQSEKECRLEVYTAKVVEELDRRTLILEMHKKRPLPKAYSNENDMTAYAQIQRLLEETPEPEAISDIQVLRLVLEERVRACRGAGNPNYLKAWANISVGVLSPPLIILVLGFMAFWVFRGFSSRSA